MTPSLPPELWRNILHLVTSDGIDYDLGMLPDDCPGKRRRRKEMTMHMRTKIDVTRVSRLFNQIAAKLLYEDIRIGDGNRAMKLLKRLSAGDADGPRQWIKRVMVVHKVNSRGESDHHKSEIAAQMVADILSLCVNLQGFFWCHPKAFSCAQLRSQMFSSKEMITHVPKNIQIFRWSSYMDCLTFGAYLRTACSTLRVLVITQPVSCHCSIHHIPIKFPLLTHLTLGGTSKSLNSLGPMPSLTEVTFLQVGREHNIISRALTPERTRRLRIVRFGPDIRVLPASNIFAPILRACPILQEIHYHSDFAHLPRTPWKRDLIHRTLQHLSVTLTGLGDFRYRNLQRARSDLCQYFRNISASHFPLLDSITVDGILLEESESTCFMLRRISDDFSSAEMGTI